MNLTMLGNSYNPAYSKNFQPKGLAYLAGPYRRGYNYGFGSEYTYSLGADEPTKKPIDWSKVGSMLSSGAQEWVGIIAEKGLPYYEAYKGTETAKAEQNSMNEAYSFMLREGYLTKGESKANYTPVIIGGGIVLLALAAGGVLVSRRRRRR